MELLARKIDTGHNIRNNVSILNYCRANRVLRFNSRPFLDRYLLCSGASARNYDPWSLLNLCGIYMSPFITDSRRYKYRYAGWDVYKACRNINRHYDLFSHLNFMPLKYLLFSRYERATAEVDCSPQPRGPIKTSPCPRRRRTFLYTRKKR